MGGHCWWDAYVGVLIEVAEWIGEWLVLAVALIPSPQ